MGIIISFTSATVTAVTKHIAKEFESQAMRAPLLFLLLAASGCILGSTRCAKETTIELLSDPIKLRYGQVHNTGTKKAMNSLYDFMQDAPYGFQTPDGLEGWVKGAKNPSSDDEDAINNRKLLISPQTMAAMRAKANEAAEQDPDI